MDRAEKLAMKQYPVPKDNIFANSVRNAQRAAFQLGYLTAEQDLALTWEDVAILITFYEQGIDNGDYRRYNDAEWMKEYSQDILRRFNEIKQK